MVFDIKKLNLCHCTLSFVLHFKSVAYGEERSCSSNGQWALFPTVSKRFWFRTFHRAWGKTSISPEWKHTVLAKMRWLFWYSVIIFCTPKSQGVICRQHSKGDTEFYWQESTKALVPTSTICKSLSLRAHTGSRAVPSCIIPTENNAGKTATAREAYKSLLIRFACLEERTNTHSWDEYS